MHKAAFKTKFKAKNTIAVHFLLYFTVKVPGIK